MDNSLKLLIYDDEQDLLDALKTFFESKGYTVLTTKDGDTAINLAKDNFPDIALLDIRARSKDAFEVLESIKNFSPKTKVVLSAELETEDILYKAQQKGAEGCIPRPIRLEELGKIIEKLII